MMDLKKTYSQEKNLKLQMDSHLDLDLEDLNPSPKSHVCVICKKVLPNETDLINHLKLHTGEKPYVCGQCEFAFSKKDNLKSHLLTHSGKKSHVCNVCQKRFLKKCYLKLHLRHHTGERPYVCDICRKAFFQGSDLQKHLLIHTGEKPYICELCNKDFRLKHTLNKHLLTHTGEKPYTCDYCEKSFSQKRNLNRHVTQHTAGTTVISTHFVCNLCQKSFTSKYILHKHLLSHTKKTNYVHQKTVDEGTVDKHDFQVEFSTPIVCNFCQKLFSSMGNFNRHLLIHTKKKYHEHQKTSDKGTTDKQIFQQRNKLFICKQCEQTFSDKAKLLHHLYTHAKAKPSVWDVCQERLSQKNDSNEPISNT